MNQITLIALVTLVVLILVTLIIIPVTKLMFNIAVTVIPFIIGAIGAYFIYRRVLKRIRR
ncbi:hypothetical protein MK852_00890 [Shewanella benthica]|uniref:hypothetical protein n=1 Tax=Shewanella sp. TaxID=50422 RepID=UPI0025833EFB|nr:hypothetical protein [Shewanella sp.]MCJ8304987.1 hypothetical protein [Shewanella sp.]MCL1060706.1 hypothetical protein [Shewanella benthica]